MPPPSSEREVSVTREGTEESEEDAEPAEVEGELSGRSGFLTGVLGTIGVRPGRTMGIARERLGGVV